MAAPISIVIPNYNGAHLMRKFLPGVLEALRAYPGGGELIVVDDGSIDNSVSWLREGLPDARVVEHERNAGFQTACTTGISAAQHEHVLLLNTDVEVLPGFIEPLVAGLAPDDVFAVGCLALDQTGNRVTENLKIPHLKSGSIRFGKLKGATPESMRKALPGAVPTLFVTGGFMAMKRSLFFALGGFDPLFEPFYYEDADLCYRAWKQGYRVLLEPGSAVLHRHEGSILEHNKARHVRRVQERNRLILLWKNLSSPALFRTRHLMPLIFRAMTKWIVLDVDFYWALFHALGRLGPIRTARSEARSRETKSDEEVFEEIRNAAPDEAL